ncbi:MAG: ATP-binding protein [Ruminococcus sp.]
MKQTDSKKNRRTPTLKVKLLGYFLLFAAVMLLFLWLFQIVFLDDFYSVIKTEQLKICTYSVADNLDNEDINELITDIRDQNNMNVGVFDTSSEIFVRVYSSRANGDWGIDILPHEVYLCYSSAKAKGGEVIMEPQALYEGSNGNDYLSGQTLNLDKKNTRQLISGMIVSGADGKEYFVMLKSHITPISSASQTLFIQLIIITVILIIFAVVFAIVASVKLSKPLVKISEGAKELSRQNYDVAFEGKGCKEIAQLSDTLNTAASELATVDNLRRELIANISHDLRTPLTMITGYAEVMRDIPGENTPENLQVIIDETERLSRLVTDLMDLSKLDASATSLEREVFCLTDSVRDIFKRYSRLIANEGYTLHFECDGNAYVLGDEIRLSQVVYNLINNAINYCGEDKTVIVRQLFSGRKVKIEVTDHGKGIDSENLKHIWDRYYRVDKEHRSAIIGTGLGLSIAKNVLELHGARFGVISQVGAGSTFWFELPTEEEVQEAFPQDIN